MTFDIKKISKYALAAAAIALAMSPEAAHAFQAGYQATGGGKDLLSQTTQIANQTAAIPTAIAWFGYIIGTAFVAFGIFKLKAHADNAAQNKLGPALGLLFTGAAFLVMPSAAALLIGTSTMTETVTQYNATAFQ